MRAEDIFLTIPGNKRKILAKRGIESAVDMLYLAPHRYYDFTVPVELDEQYVGKYVAVEGVIKNVKKSNQNKRSVLTAKLETRNGKRFNITFIGNIQMENVLNYYKDKRVFACGKLQYSPQYDSYSMLNPKPIVREPKDLTWYKVYPKYTKIGEDWLESTIKDIYRASQGDAAGFPETIPEYIRKTCGLYGRLDAIKELHYPYSKEKIREALKRNLFEDLLYFACSLELESRKTSKGTLFNLRSTKSIQKVKNILPYTLTEDQEHVLNQILEKMRDGRRVSALVQGDVGCGKSIVAFLLMLAMADSGFQSVIMAPTLVLAEQHFHELSTYANECGYKVAFLGGKQTTKEKREIANGIKDGAYQFIVGTHATIGDAIEYKNLGLIIVDEEHRFGVKQREKLVEKATAGVHSVYFSATPIPRTMASTIYRNMDVYSITQMPAGRLPVKTAIVSKGIGAAQFVKKEVLSGAQAYIVCPLIDSEDTETKLRSVTKVAEEYRDFLGMEVGVVSGKQSKEITQKTLERFKSGELKVLVSTTVIEVGVNVPNATVMVIEDAWMFGLAQLHQLRGRVGRGNKQGYCILRSNEDTERLHVMLDTTDGFVIAEKDLELRGAGNILGDEQSGKNRFLEAAMYYPKMFAKAQEFAKIMVERGDEAVLIGEMEKRSEKIYVNPNKIRVF